VFTADQFRGLEDRVIPAAIIPMYTPEEAIEELEFASKQLGYKVMMSGSHAAPGRRARRGEPGGAKVVDWYDLVGIDSDHDYDPVWAKCLELQIAPSFHNGARSILLRNSPSNFCYNHIGHFASAGDAVAKAIFFGGVTRRFPKLNFGFLEGGVGWACSLYADLIGHWEKRNRKALEITNPDDLDRQALLALRRSTGRSRWSEAVATRRRLEDDSNCDGTGGLEDLDDYSRCKIARRRTSRICSCRASTSAARRRPGQRVGLQQQGQPDGARLNAIFSSDIGHFDVPDMTEVVPEAYELVEHELLDDDDFRDFMFANAVRFWGEVNPTSSRAPSSRKRRLRRSRSRRVLQSAGSGFTVAARGASRTALLVLLLVTATACSPSIYGWTVRTSSHTARRIVQSTDAGARARRDLRGARAGWPARQRARPLVLSGGYPENHNAGVQGGLAAGHRDPDQHARPGGRVRPNAHGLRADQPPRGERPQEARRRRRGALRLSAATGVVHADDDRALEVCRLPHRADALEHPPALAPAVGHAHRRAGLGFHRRSHCVE
jgi:hypothetical protein